MRFEVTREATIKGIPTPVSIFPDNKDGMLFAWDPVEGAMTRSQAGFTNIPASAVDALEKGDDSLIRQHIVEGDKGRHQFVNCGVAIEFQFGSLCVGSLTEAPGTAK